MRRTTRTPRHIHMVGLILVLLRASATLGQTTAFTYQGQLSDGGMLASGSYDVRFALFDSAAGSAQIGANQTVPAVPVSDGVFTVQLDFGANAFPGANRFMEIAVRSAGVGSFTTLAPRQQISSSPYAIRTLSAATADALSSACVGCVTNAQIQGVSGSKVNGTIPAASVPTGSGNYIQNTSTQQANANFNIAGNGVVGGNLTVAGTLNANLSGNFIQNRTTPQAGANFSVSGNGTVGSLLSAGRVGIGTAAPTAGVLLDVNGITRVSPGGNGGFMQFGTPNSEIGMSILGAGGRADLRFGDELEDGAFNSGVLTLVNGPGGIPPATNGIAITAFGNVGIGTTDPQRPLDVAGRARVRSIPLEPSGASVCFNSDGDLLQCGASSLRLKTNVRPFLGGLDIVERLRPIDFTWKEGGAKDIGLGAEDVARVAPSLTLVDSNGEAAGVRYDRLNIVLINAINELQKQIARQQVQIEQLQRMTAPRSAEAKITSTAGGHD